MFLHKQKSIIIYQMMQDKDCQNFLKEIADQCDYFYINQQLTGHKFIEANDLAKIAGQILGLDRVFIEPDLRIAIEKALSDANHPLEEETVGVLITGSVITVGEARKILKELKS